MHRITLIPGDGIGPEVTRAARDIVLASGASVEFEEVPAGQRAEQDYGTPLPPAVFDSIAATHVALKGPTATPFGGTYRVHIERKDAKGVVITITPKDKVEDLKKAIDERITKAAEWVKANVKEGDAGTSGGVGGGKGDHGGNHSGEGDGKGKDRKEGGTGGGAGTGGGGGKGTGAGSGNK